MGKTLAYKICIVGDGGVGKTSMVFRYTDNKFSENYIMTIGSNFAVKTIKLEEYPEHVVTLQIWDLAGQPRFNVVRPLFYRGAKALIYVFDLTRKDSLQNLINWKEEIEQNLDPRPCVLVGNKSDLAKRVNKRVENQDIENIKAKLQASTYLETSARDGSNVNEVFRACVLDILESVLTH